VFAHAALFHLPSHELPRVLPELHARMCQLRGSSLSLLTITALPGDQQLWLASVWRRWS
jgi:hypothetical protein